MTILCITPNANIERAWVVPHFEAGGLFRVDKALILPSGKGNNVARAINVLGGEAKCTGFLGGYTGKQIADLIAVLGLQAKWTWIEAESRLSYTIVDPTRPQRDATLISELGPQVSRKEWLSLLQDVLEASSGARLACVSGSMPPGTPLKELTRLVRVLQENQVRVWVDCEGLALKAALQSRPAGLKINLREASAFFHRGLQGVEAAHEAAYEFHAIGIETVILTMGSKGAILVNEEGVWRGGVPQVPVVSTVGSGDAFLGGLLHGLASGLPVQEAFKPALAAGTANALSLGACRFKKEDYLEALGKVTVEPLAG